MQQSLGQFNAALHASGKSFDVLFGTVGEADAHENLCDSRLQRCPVQAVEMTLVPEIFVGSQLRVYALSLKNDSDLPAHVGGVLSGIVTYDDGAACGGNHQCGENP